MYWIVRKLAGFLFHLLADVRIEGAEHVPSQGTLLFITNHLSYFDTPLLLVAIPRRVRVFAARKYRVNPFLRVLFDGMGCIWVRQAEADTEALRKALEHLHSGGALGISPEGTRSKQTHALIRARRGAAYLASRSQAPVIPMVVWGTELIVRDLLHLRRPRVHARFGKPYHLEVSPRAKGADLDAASDDIMCALAALLPPAYRGEYAGHPRLEHWVQETGG